MFLEQFIAQTGKQSADWSDDDIRNYLDHLKAHIGELSISGSCDHRRLFDREPARSKASPSADLGNPSDCCESSGTDGFCRSCFPMEDRA